MRIGILTYHSCLNYGASLQLYASAKALERQGHEVFVYDNQENAEHACRRFAEGHFRLTEKCLVDEDFRSATLRHEIDTVLVGSDAVLWFLPNTAAGRGAYPNPFWLRWADDLPVRKALIAASCMGVMFPKCSRSQRQQIAKDLASFDYISVRDNWTEKFMMWAGVSSYDLVFDPTSCLPQLVDFSSASLPGGLERGKYIMLTFSESSRAESWLKRMTNEAHARGLKTCFIPHPDRPFAQAIADYCVEEVLDPLEWLALLANAAGYVGERFHPIVLSAFFRTPFVSSDYYSYSGLRSVLNIRSKTRDFCKRIGASKRVVPADRFFLVSKPGRVIDRVLSGQTYGVAECAGDFERILARAVGSN